MISEWLRADVIIKIRVINVDRDSRNIKCAMINHADGSVYLDAKGSLMN